MDQRPAANDRIESGQLLARSSCARFHTWRNRPPIRVLAAAISKTNESTHDGFCNRLAHCVDLGNMIAATDTDSHVDLGECVCSEDQGRLVCFEAQGRSARLRGGEAVDSDEALAFFAVCEGCSMLDRSRLELDGLPVALIFFPKA